MKTENSIKVWDIFVRGFHWSLVLAFTIAYLTEDDFLLLHSWAGYTVLALISLRLIWGFIGTHYARFSDFVYPHQEIKTFVKQTVQLRAKRYLGHNPAGGAMIILLLISLFMVTLTGMAVYGAAENAGPLADWLVNSGELFQDILEETHEFFANFTVLLIFIHVAGVIVESFIHGENLILSMFNGYKRKSSKDDI